MAQLRIARVHVHPADSTESLLPASAETMAKILDLVEDAIISVDRQQRIIVFNQAAERICGYAAGEIHGKRLEVLLPSRFGRDRGAAVVEFPGWPQASQHAPELRQIVIRRKSGEEFPAEASISEFQGDDRWTRTIILRDMTSHLPIAEGPPNFIASSESMRRLLNFARRVAVSEASTILIEGESGVGKDVLARFIHETSRRSSKAFLAINCAAIPETLLESELFGYEKGAFTDARNQKPGILEVASGGTVFLDEIGELPLILQAKLLRVLEEHRFRRLGGTKELKVDLRVITATNRDLRKAVEQGRFRADLYYRLNVIQTTIPPLRDRVDDIIPLAQHFVAFYNRRFRRDVEGFAADALSALNAHTWPGNIRELRNAVERAMLMQDGAWIRATDLAIRGDFPVDLAAEDESGSERSLAEVEQVMLVNALNKASWNQTRASHLLKISRDTLRYKMKKFNLRPPAADWSR